MEPKGEFLLQLLQGRGSGGNARNTSNTSSTSGGGGRRVNGASSSSSSEDVERSPAWQHRDPAVAALGPSHSYHAGEPLLHQQQQQANQLFVAPPPQYSGGVWTSAPPPQQQQQQQFFGFGGVHGGGPHPLIGNRYPPYPPPPSAHLAEQWRPEASEFTRRSDAAQGWLPPPRGGSDGGVAPRQWSQGNMQKAPPPPPQQQFLGNGKELLQLLLGGGSQNLKPQNLQAPEEVHVDHALSRAALVHGPIGPPKRGEPMSPGGEDLLGRFWALPNGSSSEPIMNPNLSVAEEQTRNIASLSGEFDASKPRFSPNPSKSKVSKPPGFFAEREGFPIDRNFVSSTAKALNHFSGVAKGPLAWNDGFQDDGTTTDLKLKTNAGDDRGNYHIPPNAGRFVVSTGRARENAHLKTTGQARDDSASLLSADVTESSSPSRELGRMGVRGSGRRGGGGGVGRAAELGRRSSSGQWMAVNEKPRVRNSEREASTITFNLHGPDASASAEENVGGSSSSYASPQSAAKATAADESPSGSSSSGGKSKEDMKRRRGQAQEWRMKQASPPHSHSKPSADPGSHGGAGLPSLQDGHSEGILPLASQVDRPGLPSNTVRHSMPGSATDESKQQLQYQLDEGAQTGGRERAGRYLFENGRLTWEDGVGGEEEEDVARELHFFSGYAKLVEDTQHLSTTPLATHSLKQQPTILTREETEVEEKPGNLRESREVRRHQPRMNVPTNTTKGDVQRIDFEAIRLQLLAIYKNLIPTQEEVQGQRKFLTQLDRLVSRDWSGAKLFLFGSCANDFGVRNSDIDVCLSVDDEHSSKAELVTRMAAILRSVDMQNVQALTHARVPIVKFTDPNTGINCDICVNNMLAVVNSKLLHDYSQVDPRLRQLAFLVKHWAKRRQVNETYRGTLSSYAYVLMCIHFLQQRRPAILPCLQSMQPTYEVTVGTIKCAYFDKVNTLKNFGARNKESVAELLTYFFEYWASCHDYNRWVISVRTGGYLSKDEKDWTRRIGNERHLICIEDPFEITHDLGRVVDRHSIRVLRDEFKRAARILRQDSSPATTLFEPFIREKA